MATLVKAHGDDAAKRAGRVHAAGVTPRALLIGLILTIVVDFWIHYAELIMGGVQGHSALANTSIPVGAFSLMFVLTGVNLLCRHVLPGLALRPAEMLVVYVMMTTSSVLSSSGQLHFVIPTVAAAYHYATVENGWAGIFHRFVPPWMAQTNPAVLSGFYQGKTAVPVPLWLPQMATWIGFMCALAGASLCVVVILRRQWVDQERLAFPTVALPLAVLEEKTPVFRRGLFWLGFVLPFGVSLINTIALNVPSVPAVNLRSNLDLQTFLTSPPWNAIGSTPLSFYPFVIGIAYLIPVDVTFSCWFFTLVTRAERVFGAAAGIDAGTSGSQQATFPYQGHQGAGAFIALTVVSLWMARGYLKDVVKKAFGENVALDDSDEPMSYRAALTGLFVCMATIGLTCSFLIALSFWHGYGAEAKTDAWRTSQGRVPFDNLTALLRTPPAIDVKGIGALGFGFLATTLLVLARNYFVWWPFHPVGYAIANTNTMNATWMPFFLAWVFKTLALRYGGARFYRASLPFFLGLIAGDLVGGGFFTFLGGLTGINVYPINW